MKIYDISPRIAPDIAVFPGDTPFSRRVELDMAVGDHLTLSSFTTSCHIGAHTDAPSHYAKNAPSIESRDLTYYLGKAQVIRTKPADGERLMPEDIEGVTITAPRVLFSTGTFPNPSVWTNDFAALSPELVAYLHDRGVRLVGIDTPSIDPAQAKVLTSHAEVAKHDMAVLEGIVLSDVPQGEYVLIALPLPIAEADASPVRAILLPPAANPWSS